VLAASARPYSNGAAAAHHEQEPSNELGGELGASSARARQADTTRVHTASERVTARAMGGDINCHLFVLILICLFFSLKKSTHMRVPHPITMLREVYAVHTHTSSLESQLTCLQGVLRDKDQELAHMICASQESALINPRSPEDNV
jgi:hypothetical protein